MGVRAARRRGGLSARLAGRMGLGEPFWPAQLAAAAALALYLTLPNELIMGPRWLIPGVEGVLLLGLVVTTPTRHYRQSPRRRAIVIGLLVLVSAATLTSLVLLAHYLLAGSRASGEALIVAGGVLWLTTIIVFGIWFWEVDQGGPGARSHPSAGRPDFAFPQMRDGPRRTGWTPAFSDYLYTSFTNAATFGPADAVPLTRLAKGLMAAESLIGLTTLLLVVSRAVNVLG